MYIHARAHAACYLKISFPKLFTSSRPGNPCWESVHRPGSWRQRLPTEALE